MLFTSALPLALLALLSPALGQETTSTDAAGNVYDLTLVTNARGVVTGTRTLATVAATATQAGVAVVGAPASICSTAGCPVAPTTYTQNGVIVTWFATTPTTPIPTWTSSGSIEAVSKYITTTMTAAGLVAAAQPAIGAPFVSDRRVLAGLVALIGGLVGAAVVL